MQELVIEIRKISVSVLLCLRQNRPETDFLLPRAGHCGRCLDFPERQQEPPPGVVLPPGKEMPGGGSCGVL